MKRLYLGLGKVPALQNALHFDVDVFVCLRGTDPTYSLVNWRFNRFIFWGRVAGEGSIRDCP